VVKSEININLKNQMIDESFSQGMVKNTLLMIVAERGRMLYSIVDQDRNKAVVLKEYQLLNEDENDGEYLPGFFSRILEEDELLSALQPDQVLLSVFSQQQTLIPNPLYSKDHLEEMLGITNSLNDGLDLYADEITSANAHIVYAVPVNLLKEIGDQFKNAILFHGAKAVIESQLRLNKLESNSKVAVFVRNNYFDVVITKGKELKLFNSYPYQSSEDLMYYLLFTMEQLQLNPDQTTVTCYGEIEKISSHWMLARKYIRNISFGEKPEGITYSYGFEKFSTHKYYSLFIQELCVS